MMYPFSNLLTPFRYALDGYVSFFKGEIGLLPEEWMVALVKKVGPYMPMLAAYRCRSCGQVRGKVSFFELPASAQNSFVPAYHGSYLDDEQNVRGMFICRTPACPEAQSKRTYMVL